MTPVYFLAKVGALLGCIAVFWQAHFDITSENGKLAAVGILTALGSIFYKNVLVNTILGYITRFLGQPYNPDKPLE